MEIPAIKKKYIVDEVVKLFRDIFLTLIEIKKKSNWSVNSEKTLRSILRDKGIKKDKIKVTYGGALRKKSSENEEEKERSLKNIEDEIRSGSEHDLKLIYFLIVDLLDFKEFKCLREIYKGVTSFNHKFDYELENFKDMVIENVNECYYALQEESGEDFSKAKEEIIKKFLDMCKTDLKPDFSEHIKKIEEENSRIISELNKKLVDLLRRRQRPCKHDFKEYLGGTNMKHCKVDEMMDEVVIEKESRINFYSIFDSLKEETSYNELLIIFSSSPTESEKVGLSLEAKVMEDSRINGLKGMMIVIKSSEVEDDTCDNFFRNDKVLRELEEDVTYLQKTDIFFLFEFLGDVKDHSYFLLYDLVKTFSHRKHIVLTDEENAFCIYDYRKDEIKRKLFKISD